MIDQSWAKLTITHVHAEERAAVTVPLTPSPVSLFNADVFHVSIFGTKAQGIDMGTEASEYFSHHLGKPVRLLYIGGNGQREIPGAVFMPKHKYRALSIAVNDKLQPQRVRFADAAPLLITSSASEEDARQRLPPSARGEDLIVRFRPNIHVDVGGEVEPYDEDRWDLLTIRSKMDSAQEVSVRCLFRTVRCLSLNADLAKGSMITTNRQLYGLLAKDRRVNELFPREIIFILISLFLLFALPRANERASKLTNVHSFILHADKPVFGQYACAGPSGAVLRVGDHVEVSGRVDHPISPMSAGSPITPITQDGNNHEDT